MSQLKTQQKIVPRSGPKLLSPNDLAYRMRRKLRLLALIPAVLLAAFGLVVLSIAGRALYSRAAFGTWDPTALPNRISYCDRTFYPGPHVTRARIESTGNAFGVFPIQQVSATVDGKPSFAKPIPDQLRRSGSLPCAMSVYLKTGSNDYVAYVLSGGP